MLLRRGSCRSRAGDRVMQFRQTAPSPSDQNARRLGNLMIGGPNPAWRPHEAYRLSAAHRLDAGTIGPPTLATASGEASRLDAATIGSMALACQLVREAAEPSKVLPPQLSISVDTAARLQMREQRWKGAAGAADRRLALPQTKILRIAVVLVPLHPRGGAAAHSAMTLGPRSWLTGGRSSAPCPWKSWRSCAR